MDTSRLPDWDLIVVGGGAAGFFGAIAAAEHAASSMRILILEQGRDVLNKVRISGGGRCNVTHAEFDPNELVRYYPRGERELRGPFHKFGPGDTMDWFEQQGVSLKIEDDNRVFPCSDDSDSIVTALQNARARLGIQLQTGTKVTGVVPQNSGWQVQTKTSSLSAKHVLLASGSTPSAYKWLAKLGIDLVDAVPSLFTFKVDETQLHALAGISVTEAQVKLPASKVITRGPLLVTHWGMSGPAILRASAEAAISLHALDYKTSFGVSWTHSTVDEALEYLRVAKAKVGSQSMAFNTGLPLPKRLWLYLLDRASIPSTTRWADLTRKDLSRLATTLADDTYLMTGQSRYKAEFVTAGGIDLKAMDMRTFAVKAHPGLYAAGELLNIDGVTGGFNFQAAWTGAHLAGRAIAASLSGEQS